MWIKHNSILLNTDDISYIERSGCSIYAHMKSMETINIGRFKSPKEANTMFSSITSKLLFKESDEGIIIKDTFRRRKNANRKSD